MYVFLGNIYKFRKHSAQRLLLKGFNPIFLFLKELRKTKGKFRRYENREALTSGSCYEKQSLYLYFIKFSCFLL